MEKSVNYKRLALWGGAVIILAVGIWALAKYGNGSVNNASSGGGTIQDPVTSADWTSGSALSKTTLIEYADFQCPSCGAFYPEVKSLQQKYGAQFLFVYRYFPLTAIHQNADLAARAAEAAGAQGKFWEVHDLLFEHQNDWAERADAQKIFQQYAQGLGLDVNKFNVDIDSQPVKDRIARDLASGDRAGVAGTPTFYLNNKQITNLSTYGDLESDLAAAIGN